MVEIKKEIEKQRLRKLEEIKSKYEEQKDLIFRLLAQNNILTNLSNSFSSDED